MAEFISDLGYLAMKKESTKGTAVIPNVYIPIFSESLAMNMNLNDVNPIMGLKAKRLTTIKGMRDYKGEIVALGEPNVAGYLLDMFLRKSGTSGSNPYTHTFVLSTSANPNSYTVDILRGQIVYRYIGVEAYSIGAEFDDNLMKLKVGVSALNMLGPVEITNNATGTLTLSIDHDPAPTTGFVATDTVRLFKADGSVVDTTVSSVTNGTVLVVGSATGVVAGDMIALRPATPSYTLQDPFEFARTQFKFGATASAAQSATHTPVQEGSNWNLIHELLPEEGRKASGSYNPVSLIRGLGDIEVMAKIFHDTPDDEKRFAEHEKRAISMEHVIGSTGQYSLKVLANNLVIAERPTNISVGEVIFTENTYKARYDTSDAAMFSVVVINSISTI